MKVNQMDNALAITMWDSSWLRRRYAGGGFESFDQALDELVERGYNAVRIDAFPHMIANRPDGTNCERFLDPPGVSHQKYGFAQWGSQWTVYVYPRRDIVEFLKKCEQRGVWVILSTWLKPTSEPRNEWLEGPQDLIRVWDETLHFLQENDCLKSVIAVDVQNEFPWYSCNNWLVRQLNCMTHDTPDKTALQRKTEFYRAYFNTVLTELKARWPEIPFSASHDNGFFENDRDMDYSAFDWFDVHIWAQRATCDFIKDTGYLKALENFGDPHHMYTFLGGGYVSDDKRIPGDIHFEKMNDALHDQWYKNRGLCEEWMEESIAFVAETGKKYGIPYGCTEGWGTILWAEHPMLSWDLIKDAGMIAAKLGAKYGYAFNCQSNFCEPQFIRLWRDVEYHKELTDIIKNTKL